MARVFVSASVSVVRADNPGAMTLEGTNTWVVQAPGGGCVVVDPGPDCAEHVSKVAAIEQIGMVLLTHRHHDHTGAVDALVHRTQVPVRAFDSRYCRDAPPLVDGQCVSFNGVDFQVIHTPGHTCDSVCFVVSLPGEPTMVLTGDTVLGRGSTVIDHPDGVLADYLASLERLEVLASVPDDVLGLPGHGSVLSDLAGSCRRLHKHRLGRIAQVRQALEALGDAATVEELTNDVYPGIDRNLREAAKQSVRAQLAYLDTHHHIFDK